MLPSMKENGRNTEQVSPSEATQGINLSDYLRDQPDRHPNVIAAINRLIKSKVVTILRRSQMTSLAAKVDLDNRRLYAHISLTNAMRRVREAENEAHFRATLESVPSDIQEVMLRAHKRKQQFLLEIDLLRIPRNRYDNGVKSRSHAQRAAQSSVRDALDLDDAVSPDLSDTQIQALAFKAVATFSSLPPAEGKRQYAAWRQHLKSYLPAHVLVDVQRYVDIYSELAA
jgi:hypothetical protein